MSLFKRRTNPDRIVVEIGDPWRINGTKTTATSAVEVRAEIEALADPPVEVVFRRPDGQERTSVLTEDGLIAGTLADHLARTTPEAEETPEDTGEDQSLADSLLGEHQDSDPTPPAAAEVEDSANTAPEPSTTLEPEQEEPRPTAKLPRGLRRATSTSAQPAPREEVSEEEPSILEIAHDEPAASNESTTEGAPSRRRWIVGAGGVAAAAVLLGCGVLIGTAVSGNAPHLPLEPAVAVPEGAEAVDLGEGSVVGITEAGVYVLEGNELTVRDPKTGQVTGEAMTADAEDQVRVSATGDADVIAVSEDKFYVRSKDGAVEESTGRVSLRGGTPVAVKDDQYTVLPEISWTEIPKNAGVFGGVEDHAVFAKAPDQVVVDGEATTLKAPEKDAEIDQWVQVTDTSVVVIWKEGKTTTLTVHSVEGGEITDETEVDDSEVTFTGGSVRIGDTRYVTDGAIEEMCDGGALVGTTAFCPTEADTWESPDGAVAATKPVAATETTYVNEKNQAIALTVP